MTAFDLQMDPSRPGLQFHKLDGARDRNFWAVRVSRDIRIIVHRTQASLMLCYVDHHDQAYRWAEQRKLETHPNTGAAQLVEVKETVQEVTIPVYVEVEQPAQPKPALFVGVPEDELLGYGVPVDWLVDVRRANEDTLLELSAHLPNEAAEALLELAVGGRPQRKHPVAEGIGPFDHPDAQRRFRVMTNREELERALDFPWDKWSVFLHPVQREVVERDFGGPARVSGSAGTGKTVVALHRAVHLARANLHARVLLTTFSDTLANFLRAKLRVLISGEPATCRACGGPFGRRHRQAAVPAQFWRADHRISRADPPTAGRGRWRRRRRQVCSTVPDCGVGAGGGRLATGDLGSVPRRAAQRAQTTAARESTTSALVGIRADSVWHEIQRADHTGRDVRSPHVPVRRGRRPSL